MRQLRIMQHITLDGVIQHSADEGGFPFGEWSAAYRTPQGRDAVLAAWGERFDLLLGRRTYDIWSGFWPTAPAIPMKDRMEAATKYVVTHRPDSLTWGPSAALGPGSGPDLVAEIGRIKAQDGPDLILAGSSTLAGTLLRNGLVDGLVLAVYPLVLGTGKRLFAEEMQASSLELVSTLATPTGVLLNAYKVGGARKDA